jgi:hypothetical protein
MTDVAPVANATHESKNKELRGMVRKQFRSFAAFQNEKGDTSPKEISLTLNNSVTVLQNGKSATWDQIVREVGLGARFDKCQTMNELIPLLQTWLIGEWRRPPRQASCRTSSASPSNAGGSSLELSSDCANPVHQPPRWFQEFQRIQSEKEHRLVHCLANMAQQIGEGNPRRLHVRDASDIEKTQITSQMESLATSASEKVLKEIKDAYINEKTDEWKEEYVNAQEDDWKNDYIQEHKEEWQDEAKEDIPDELVEISMQEKLEEFCQNKFGLDELDEHSEEEKPEWDSDETWQYNLAKWIEGVEKLSYKKGVEDGKKIDKRRKTRK